MALSRGGILPKREHPLDQSCTHTPHDARGFCLLDTVDSYWKNGYCPYSQIQSNNVIERIDHGASFYKNHFYGQGNILIFGIF